MSPCAYVYDEYFSSQTDLVIWRCWQSALCVQIGAVARYC